MQIQAFPNRFLALFIVLSAFDFLLTSLLLRASNEQVYESNPVALWFLTELGWLGMAVFKFLSVFLVLSLVLIIYQRRPQAGKQILMFGCAVLALVVLYSGAVAAYVTVQKDAQSVSEKQELECRGRELDRSIKTMVECLQHKRRLSELLLSGELSLPQAIGRLRALETSSSIDHSNSTTECLNNARLAVSFVEYTIGTVDEPEAPGLRNHLESELWRHYGVSLPCLTCTVPDRARLIWMAGELERHGWPSSRVFQQVSRLFGLDLVSLD